MQKFNASAFYQAASSLRRAQTIMEEREDKESPRNMTKGDRSTSVGSLRELQSALLVLDCKVTAIAVDQLLKTLAEEEKPLKYADFATRFKDIDARIRDELSLTKMFVLDERKDDYFEPREPLFGADVEVRFPSAAYELDEAAKCFALSRPTAAVFHLMRIMEIGINAVALCLKLPAPTKGSDRNWGVILNKMKAEIERRNAVNPPAWTTPTDRATLSDAYVSLDAVRVAWRNTTMHIENKYSDEEAEHIFGAVRGFMKKLAARHDERGMPLA
jgi:hypothetical protein